MALNGISTATGVTPVDTKILRRNMKLSLAQTKRQTTGTPGYRPLHAIVGSHIAYVGTSTTTISGTASPIDGHPWS